MPPKIGTSTSKNILHRIRRRRDVSVYVIQYDDSVASDNIGTTCEQIRIIYIILYYVKVFTKRVVPAAS